MTPPSNRQAARQVRLRCAALSESVIDNNKKVHVNLLIQKGKEKKKQTTKRYPD